MMHISFNRTDRTKRGIRYCPTCDNRRRYVATYQEWYGWTIVCCGCGDRWTDGERHERPFRRGWRKQAISKARELWIIAAEPKTDLASDHNQPELSRGE